MNRSEFISAVANDLRVMGVKKPVRIEKRSFFIRDPDNNEAEFTIKSKDKLVIYNQDDISNILDACVRVTHKAMRRGDSITIRGFGSMALHHRAPRRVKAPGTNDWYAVEGHYVPKFTFGNELRRSARIFELYEHGDLEEAKKEVIRSGMTDESYGVIDFDEDQYDDTCSDISSKDIDGVTNDIV